jgi:hypothetical protein
MRVLRSVLVACVLSVAVFGASGCSDQSDEANKLVDQMNVLVGKSNSLESQISKLVEETNKIDPTSKDVAKAPAMIAEAQTKLDQDKTNTKAVISLLDQITALDVSGEMKTYANQQKAIAELEVQELGLTDDLLATFRQLYDPKKAKDYTQAQLDELTNKANDTIAKDNALLSEISGKQGASDQFFKDNVQ